MWWLWRGAPLPPAPVFCATHLETTMASIYADPKLRSKRSYIAASSFNTVLYTYTTSLDPTTLVRTGSLGATTGATAGNCSQGRILRENGSRLYPDANPGISTLMVGVYDANSGLKGYIDPNAPQFAVFNSDKPVEMVDGGDNNTAVAHKGQPVYTTGGVISTSPTNGIGYGTGAGGAITQGTNKSTGVTLNAVSGAITMHNASLASGASVNFTLTNSSIAANSLLVVNHTSAGTLGSYTAVVASCTTGSAIIRVTNISGGSLGEAIVLTFAVINAAVA